jgi:glycosyltransferase involved in cell wall biosynthesis
MNPQEHSLSPKVSVVIPTYNRADKVDKGIQSVLAQTFRDFEVVVVDDGSSDNTGVLLQELFGDKIRYFYQRNQGASIARNRGVAEARGEWIAFLDSDDIWEPTKLEWQFKALEKIGPRCGACYTDVRLFNHDEKRTMFQMAEDNYRHKEEIGVNPEAMRLLVRPGGAGMVICLSSLMGRSDIIRKISFDPKLLYSQDSDFMFRLAMLTGFCYVNRPLIWFDRSPAEIRHVGVSADWNKLDFFLKDSQLRLEGLLAMSDQLPPKVRAVIGKQLSEIHSGWANWYLWNGDNAMARRAVSKSLRLDPTFKLAATWLLTWTLPSVAARAVSQRQQQKTSATTV